MMTPTGYAFLALTLFVVLLVSVLAFAVLRFASAAREARRGAGGGRSDSVMLASALEEAFERLKAQERATAARAEASERLSSQIVDSLTSGLIVVDAERHVRIVNPAARRILTIDDGAGVSDAMLERVPPLAEVIGEALTTGVPVVRRGVALKQDGQTKRLGVTVSPLNGGPEPAGAICLFSDLTAVAELEEQLRLKEALARLGELTAGLAHEFRNGLATIHGYGRLLDPAALPDPQRQYVEGIREETQALGEIVTNFLNFARPDPLVLTAVDLRSVVERAAEDIPDASVVITGEFAPVYGDDLLLRQALSNLFRNSVEACQAVQRAAVINVAARADATTSAVTLTVTDNGPGISADALPRLFHPFFTTRRGGTGLGLAIVQKVIVSHNGRITAGNHPMGGAMFTITLPAPPHAASPNS